jgi:hypothetical protein
VSSGRNFIGKSKKSRIDFSANANEMISRIKAFVDRWRRLPHVYDQVEAIRKDSQRRIDLFQRRIDMMQEALGRIEARQLAAQGDHTLAGNEFRAFSQWGEDGIIQFLLRHIEIGRKIFVEFGADIYNFESNTRFLLSNDNWTGLVIDSNEDAIRELKTSTPCVLYDLRAISAFITTQNINQLLSENGIVGEIGILSIDIDGNDYWLWDAIDVVNPTIVIIEYNFRFGKELAVTIPYDPSFERAKAHSSRLYFGASLKALCSLGKKKGYAFVGCNSNGVNAFFVRRDKKPEFLKELTAEEGYVAGKFGELFERDGDLVRRTPREECEFLQGLGLPLINVDVADT